MNNIKIFFFLSIIYLGLSIQLHAEKLCKTDESIEQQKRRYITQGLLVACMKEKIIFSWPVKVCECWISSLYGKRRSGFHSGVDFAAIKGTDVFAAADGYVTTAQKNNDPKGYGNMILIEHAHEKSMYKTRYAHLDTIEKQIYNQFQNGKNVAVKQGQKIGTVGATGHVITKSNKNDPSHLHFEIYKNDQRIDPLKYLFASEIMLLKNKKIRKS